MSCLSASMRSNFPAYYALPMYCDAGLPLETCRLYRAVCLRDLYLCIISVNLGEYRSSAPNPWD